MVVHRIVGAVDKEEAIAESSRNVTFGRYGLAKVGAGAGASGAGRGKTSPRAYPQKRCQRMSAVVELLPVEVGDVEERKARLPRYTGPSRPCGGGLGYADGTDGPGIGPKACVQQMEDDDHRQNKETAVVGLRDMFYC